jgi:hypothetical protein
VRRVATPANVQSLMKLGAKFMTFAPHWKGRATPEESVKDMLQTITNASIENGDAGAFVSHHGNQEWL